MVHKIGFDHMNDFMLDVKQNVQKSKELGFQNEKGSKLPGSKKFFYNVSLLLLPLVCFGCNGNGE